MGEELQQGTETVEVTQDNSQGAEAEYSEEDIAKALDEPEENTTEDGSEPQEDPQKEEPKDNTIQCPDKFKNKDGSINVENLVKSYTELESNSSQQKASWEKEKAELQKAKDQLDQFQKQQEESAKQAGFNSSQEMQNMYELVNTEANEYYKYIGQTDDPERVTGKFSPEVIRNVTIATERRRYQLEQQFQQNAQTAEMAKIENTIQQLCEKHNDILQDEKVKDFVVKQFTKYGSALDFETASAMLALMEERDGGFKQKVKELTDKENQKTTDKLSAISNQSSAPTVDEEWANFDNLTPQQQERIIGKYL